MRHRATMRSLLWSLMAFLALLQCRSALAAEQPKRVGSQEALDTILGGQGGHGLWDYQLRQAKLQWAQRRRLVEHGLRTRAEVLQYQARLRADCRKLFGDFPDRCPLNAATTSVIACEGYRIEKVAYESWPNHHVTANLYVPTSGKPPYPGVLVLCGHAPLAKTYEPYQRVSILLAKNGFLALIVDPISQGERLQILDAAGTPLVPYSGAEHSIIDIISRLVGRGSPYYEAWDNIRGIDYLFTRPELDRSQKIGCTGTSGGGTQTTYLMALDERIGPAAPSGYVHMQEEYVTLHNQIDDGCQNLANEGALGIEVPDYMILHAPEPVAILTSSHDNEFWGGVYTALGQTSKAYAALGVADRVAIFDTPDQEHGFYPPHRKAAVRWMRRWLLNDDSPVNEPEAKVQPADALRVTRTGQVGSHWPGEIGAARLTLDRAQSLGRERERFWKETSAAARAVEVRRLLGLRGSPAKLSVRTSAVIQRPGYHIEKLVIQREGEVPLPALLFVPDGASRRLPATLYVDGRGKHTDAGSAGPIDGLVRQGQVVLSLDVRGFGETVDKLPVMCGWYAGNDEYRSGMLAMHIGRSLLGQRVDDVLVAFNVLFDRKEVDPAKIGLVGIGRAGPVVIHAAFLEPRISEVTVRGSIVSWLNLVAAPTAPNLITHVVPAALTRYDLPDLLKSIAPRKVRIEAPVDAQGRPRG